MASIKGIIIEIGGDTSKLQSALKKVNSSTSSLSKELRGINSLLKLDPKNTELVSQKQTVLKQNIEQTSAKLNELRKAQEQADNTIAKGGEISEENYRNLQREIINTENKLKNLQVEASKWTTAGRSIEEFGTKVTNISNKIDKMGTTLTTRLTLPITALATATVNTAANFESSMRQVAATMGITVEEIEKGSESYKILEEAAMKCGETTKYSASEAADALNYLALAGYDAKKSAEVLPKVLNLAAAGDLELATASDMVTDAMAALNLETKDLDRYINEMAKTSQKSNTSVAQLGEGTLTVAGTAKLANMSLETMNAELGILANNGIKGAEGGTHLRNIILSLTSPTDVAAKALKNLGINVSDNKGNIRDLNDIMSDFNKKLNGLSDEKKTNIISTIFNKTDISAVNALIKGSGKEFSDLKKQISNCDNAAQDMADTMNSSLKGQATLLRSQIESIAITTGKKLMPTIKKTVEQISNLASGFSKLTDEQVETIVKTAALVAAIGPATKIVGTLGKTIGTGIKTVGSFSQAVGLMGKTSTEAFENASTGTQTLTKALTAMTSPAGLATVAITAVAAGATYLALKQTEALRETNKLAEEISNSKQKYEEYNQSIDKTTDANLSQINSVSKLKDKLKTLVDENGKIKEGYEGRVDFILNELNGALETEYKRNDNIVQSYKELQGEIDATIEKKRAEIKLEAYKQKYENAINTETDAVAKQKEVIDKLGMSYDEVREKYGDWIDKYNNSTLTTADIDNLTQAEYNQRAELAKLSIAYKEQESVVKQCTEDKKNYENNYALFVEGKYNEIGKTITDTTKNWTDSSIKEIQSSITQQQEELSKYKQIYERTGNEVAEQQMKQAQQNLQNLANELINRTSTIGTLGLDEISAWKTLANSSYEEYKNAISKMKPEMQQEIQDITGVIVADTGLASSTREKANDMTTNFKNKLKLSGKTQEEIDNVSSKLNGDTSVENGAKSLAQDANRGFNNNVDGTTWGSHLASNIANGLASKQAKAVLERAANSAAAAVAAVLHHTTPDKGPMKDDDKWMPDMIDNFVIGINNNKSKLTKSAEKMAKDLNNALNTDINFPQVQDFGKFQGHINNKIIDSTKTIFTTPNLTIYTQEFDARKIANEVNKIFGSQY